MQKKYSECIAPEKELNLSPSEQTINKILAFSKSLEVVKTKKKKLFINLN